VARQRPCLPLCVFARNRLRNGEGGGEGDGRALVTLTQADENDFVFKLLTSELDASYRTDSYNWFGPWLGAERIPDSGASDAAWAWTWVTGEPFTYADWHPGEPTDQSGDGETRAFYYSSGYVNADVPPGGATWADVAPEAAIGFVVEFEPR
jgi:hypothetical protein